MLIFSDINKLQTYIKQQKKLDKTIGFVPTMGGLHKGHLSLVEVAKKQSDIVVVSIFVNPAQFGENEDFDSYPRPIKDDTQKLESLNVDVLFLPDVETIYPKNSSVFIDMGEISKILCGKTRPNFFNGIALVITKLFNIIQPDIAVFGEKDRQQLIMIKQLVIDLNFNIKIISAPTIREKNGLAMSSRNSYLTDKDKKIAPLFYKILSTIKYNDDLKIIKQQLNKYFEVDYLEILDFDTLEKITTNSKRYIVISAVILGKTRLIDNLEVKK
ncbi:Pantoate--beta-alanine ligase [hydrothermal vent metagenome]|uniref:pantoate--beta-alanine ligase (AMP-forming) n=1 Tax=hydrothermal vent metagenome TaxID=652676 RepID=A0A1W1C2T7_9ZZZZ